MITILTCRGTGEPLAGTANLLTNVTRKLAAERYAIGPDVDYPASIGPVNPSDNPLGVSEDQSIAAGITALSTAIRAQPNPVGLLGYSLGAEVVSRFLEAKARGEFADCKVVFAANVANPLRCAGDSIITGATGFGVAGQHGPWPPGTPTWEVANPADGITCCPVDSPLRPVSDTITGLTFVGQSWTAALLQLTLKRRWQPYSPGWLLHPIRTYRLYDVAATELDGYLNGDTHYEAYIADGYCATLAKTINAWTGP